METYIAHDIDLRLVLSPERSTVIPALLRYRTDDPYAVHMTFHTGSDGPVHWTFARELLLEGMVRPCGQGDVRVWPSRADGLPVMCLALSSPDGDALLQAPASSVGSWLERTSRAVPPGGEAGRLGLEEGLASLLSPAPQPGSPEPGCGGPDAAEG